MPPLSPTRLQSGRPSRTARLVAFARGVGGGPFPPDHTVPVLLDGLDAYLLKALASPPAREVARWVSLGLLDHVLLRTAVLDQWVETALAETDVRQLVVLGAGFDGRAWRMEALSKATVYEVDHPATARSKRLRAQRLSLHARDVVFVEVDFERDALAERLTTAGFLPDALSFWIWEGVTPYLPLSVIEHTLHQIRRCAAPRSRLAMSYADPSLLPRPSDAVRRLFERLGEPLRGPMTSDEAHAMLHRNGFVVHADLGEPEWGRRIGRPTRPFPLARAERLLLAERSAPR